LLFGLAAIADLAAIALIVDSRRVEKVVMLGIDLRLMRQQLVDKGRPGFTVPGKLARRQKDSRGAITQHVVILDFRTLQLGHRYRVHFGWGGLTTSE
jgi:hypothetical protein